MMRSAAVGLLVFLTAGCAIKQPSARPDVSIPAAWTEDADSTDNAGARPSLESWWVSFRDPALTALIIQAVQGNPDLRIAAARIRESRAERGIAASALLPNVDAAGAAARTLRSDSVPPFNATGPERLLFGDRTQNVFDAAFDARWEIDLFGGTRFDVQAAVAQVQAAEEDQRDVLTTVVAEVARNYAELIGAQQRIDILDANLRAQAESVSLARARLNAGLGTDLDVTRAQALVENLASERPELERVAKQCEHRILVLLGRTPESAMKPGSEGGLPIPPEIPTSLPSDLLRRRPDLRRAEREVAAATARIGVVRADLFPRFSLVGNFGRRSSDFPDLTAGASQFWTFVPGIRWPIFSAGRLRATVRAHEARQQQLIHSYERAVLAAFEDVENSLVRHTRARRRRVSLASAVDLNRRSVELATARYVSGLESFLSVLDAQRSLYAAQDQLAQSDTAVITTLIALYKALGGGWQL